MMDLPDKIRIEEFSSEYQKEILNLIVTVQQTEFEISITAEDQPDLSTIRLLDRLLKWAESKKIKEIYLGTTSKFLAAHRFYEKNGFWKIDKSDLPGTFPVMKVDTRFYKFELSKMTFG